MNRERIAWLVSVVLIAMLAFQLPGTLARRDDDYAFTRTLIDLHRKIDDNYVEPVDEEKLRLGSINGMMGELDPYSIYVPASKQKEFDFLLEGSFEGVGIELSQLENGDIQVVSPIEDSPALKAGVMAGDIIVKVNGQEIKGQKIADVQKLIKGEPNSLVRLTVRHLDGREIELSMKRQQINIPTVKGFRRAAPDKPWEYWVYKDPKIGYLRITQFTSDTMKELRPVLQQLLGQGMQGLVLDLRFNPGGRLDQAKDVVNLFLREGVIVMTKGLHRAEEIGRATPGQALDKQVPMVVLVNEHSASAAEIVSGSLKDNKRATVVGTRTYGKGSVQELIPMEEDGGELKLTVAYYYLPSGRLVHRKKGAIDWGVDPQVDIPMTEDAEQKVFQQQSELDYFHVKPLPKPGQSAKTAPASAPSTQPVDIQLEAAVDTVIDLVTGKKIPLPATQPVTQPAH